MLAALWGLWFTFAAMRAEHVLHATDNFGPPLAYTETVKEAVSIKVESSKAIAQATLVLIGVLWGLIIAKKEERVLSLSKGPEMSAFVVANYLLIASLYVHVQYSGLMSAVHTATAGPPPHEKVGQDEKGAASEKPLPETILDYRKPLINDYFEIQMLFLGAGVLLTGSALFCAHLLPQEVKKCEPISSGDKPS